MKWFNFAAIRNFILTHKLLSLLVICVIGVGGVLVARLLVRSPVQV